MTTPTPLVPGPPATSTADLRVRSIVPLVTPAELQDEIPLPTGSAGLVAASRRAAAAIVRGQDDRLLVVVGPCSVHDPAAALDYAHRLAPLRKAYADALEVVMRVYFEKPRTTVGWKGLINDPGMDGSYDVGRGLRLARTVLLDVLATGLPAAAEFLEPTSPQYIADAVSWGAIGARTPESQVHRQLASGLSMPVGFKNATDGDVQVAIDGCTAAGAAQAFFGIDRNGRASLVRTAGNPDCHVVLRGSRSGPNYRGAELKGALRLIEMGGRPRRVVLDASHGNSGKDHVRQAVVVDQIATAVGEGEAGICGLMMESFLLPGRQEPAPAGLTYGQSVTDACMGWETTEALLERLAAAVTRRRRLVAPTGSAEPPG
jgi:3-deoxy-7-phosphoheptulonate synthase